MFERLGKVQSDVDRVLEEVKKQAQTEIKPALNEAVNQLSSEIPKLEAIKWQQYTPYFNDGEPCEFGVYDIHAKFKGDDVGGWSEDGYYDLYEVGDKKKGVGLSDTQIEMLTSLNEIICGLEDVLKTAFGDHVEITMTMDGKLEVEEYEHE